MCINIGSIKLTMLGREEEEGKVPHHIQNICLNHQDKEF